MNKPRALIVYFSMSGHSRDIAKAIAERVGADLDAFRWNRPAGATVGLSVLWRPVVSRILGRACAIIPSERPLALYDLVIVGGPIWAGRLAPPITRWLKQTALRNSTRLAVFASASRPTPFPQAFFDVCTKMSQKVIVTADSSDAAKGSKAEATLVRAFCEAVLTPRSVAA